MTWKVEFNPQAFKELKKLDRKIQIRILKFVNERITKNTYPKSLGFPLKGNLGGLWKYRIGDYRLICLIEEHRFCVQIIAVGHRKDIYKKT